MKNDSIVHVLFWAIPLGLALMAGCIALANRIQRNRVKQHSARLKLLRTINSKYNFYNTKPEYIFKSYVNSKAKLDSFNFDRNMENTIYENQELFSKLLYEIKTNRRNYSLYVREIKESFPKTARKDAEKCGITVKRFNQIEKQLLKAEAKKPIRDIKVICQTSYESPKGRNYYSRKTEYSFDDISALYKNAVLRDTRKVQMARERSLVTPKLRYSVLQRDGFRCKICGRSEADGAVLHVDHIIPVSKGGKTEMSNLQTLCDYCNIGKGASYGFSPNYSSSAKG